MSNSLHNAYCPTHSDLPSCQVAANAPDSARAGTSKLPDLVPILNRHLQAKAQGIVQFAIREGRLVRPDTCPACDRRVKTHAHHADYSKPLDVVWMCHRCHMSHHKYLRGLFPEPPAVHKPSPYLDPRAAAKYVGAPSLKSFNRWARTRGLSPDGMRGRVRLWTKDTLDRVLRNDVRRSTLFKFKRSA